MKYRDMLSLVQRSLAALSSAKSPGFVVQKQGSCLAYQKWNMESKSFPSVNGQLVRLLAETSSDV